MSQCLLAHSCDPTVVSGDQHTPLQLAIGLEAMPIFKLLLSHPKMEINQVTDKGTALHFAIKTEKWNYAQLLLDNGARPEVDNNCGVSSM
jgi:ankyrin repeat protein